MDCRSYYRSPSSAFARWMRMGRVLVACLAVASASACAQSKVSTAPPQGPAPSPAAPPPPEPTVAPSPTLTVPESQRPLVIGGAEPVRVSALLPLSGSAASVGSVLRNAAEMALFDVADERFVLSFYDTQSTPQGAVAAANEALSGGAQMIVGPLFGASAAQVGPLARARGVPVLTFSNNQAVAGDGVWVFGLLPADQVERVVGYAASTGLARYGAVVPANAYGDAVRESLLDALAKARAGVPRVVTYPPGADTAMFGEIIERFATDAELDAVLIPEGGAALRNIAPQLAFHDVDQSETRFLGTALWSDPTLGSENTLQDAWFAAPSPLLRKGFEERYQRLYGAVPPGLASLAYDAVSVAAVLARQPGGPSFDAASLTQPSGFFGADGIFRLLPDGGNQRGLAVLRVTRTGFEIQDPAPQSFNTLIN